MKAIDRKLLHDMLHMKGQVTAIALVLACGVAMFAMSLSAVTSLQTTMTVYYRDHRFADVFAHVKRAPESLLERIAEIPGVARAEARIVANVNLHVEGLAEPASARLISVPDRGRPVLNDLYLRRGRWVEGDRPGEVLVSETFAQAHDLWPGDSVNAVINQRLRSLTIVGIVLSPEFIYEIREGEILPDPKRFGVFWMGRRELEAAFDLEGAFNDIVIQRMAGSSEAEVIARLDDLTARYGGLGAYGRDDQASHMFIASEIEQLKGMALIVPTIFLAVAAFLFNMVISRMIKVQREQIAALKAFGYSSLEIGLHYGKFVALIVLVGVILGTGLGAWLGKNLSEMYSRFFRFPELYYILDYRAFGPAALLSAAAGAAGAYASVRRAATLPPAEAMRPEPPGHFRPTLVERIGLQRFLSSAARMVIRNIERRPGRSVLSCLGTSLAVSILILGNLNSDLVTYLLDFEFQQTKRQDVTVSFVEPAEGRAGHEIGRMPGVLRAEAFRAVPVRLRSEHRSRRVALMGLEPRPALVRLIDRHGREAQLPTDGVLMSDALAKILRIDVGDELTVEILEGRRAVVHTSLTGVIEDYTGLSAYMDIRALRRVTREQDSISGAFVSVDPAHEDALYARLRNTPRIAGVTIKKAAMESFEETIAENLLTIRTFTIAFAVVIAFGVVYNSARISLSERGRELATLRVIGFTRGEISLVLLGELTLLTLISIPLGMAIGYWLTALTIEAVQTEHQRLPLIVGWRSYGFAAAITMIAALASGLVVRRSLDRLDLIGVLKSPT